MPRVWLGPWRLVTDPDGSGATEWRPPVGDLGCLDLASTAQCAEPTDPASRGLGLFLLRDVANPGSDYTLLSSEDPADATPDEQTRNTWEARLGFRPTSTRLVHWVFETLQAGDPAGLAAVRPLTPHPTGFDLWFANRRVLSVPWRWGQTGTALVRTLLRRKLLRYRELALAGTLRDALHHRRCADWLCTQYGVSFDDLRPPEWPAEETLLPHETTLSDDFNRADETLATSGWTEVVEDWNVVSNQAVRTNDNLIGYARYDSDLSTDDHTTTVDVIMMPASASRFAGPCVRFAAAASTYYVARMNSGASPSIRIAKVVTGTLTALGSGGSISQSLPDTVGLRVNGTSLVSIFNGSDLESITDSSFDSNLRGGMYGHASGSGSCDFDNWQAEDVAAGGATQPPRSMHQYRQRRVAV